MLWEGDKKQTKPNINSRLQMWEWSGNTVDKAFALDADDLCSMASTPYDFLTPLEMIPD